MERSQQSSEKTVCKVRLTWEGFKRHTDGIAHGAVNGVAGDRTYRPLWVHLWYRQGAGVYLTLRMEVQENVYLSVVSL